MISDREWPIAYPFFLIKRELWGAAELPTGSSLNSSNVNAVVVLHTGGDECTNPTTCTKLVRDLQVRRLIERLHQREHTYSSFTNHNLSLSTTDTIEFNGEQRD